MFANKLSNSRHLGQSTSTFNFLWAYIRSHLAALETWLTPSQFHHTFTLSPHLFSSIPEASRSHIIPTEQQQSQVEPHREYPQNSRTLQSHCKKSIGH